jgi:hypothetical protein
MNYNTQLKHLSSFKSKIWQYSNLILDLLLHSQSLSNLSAIAIFVFKIFQVFHLVLAVLEVFMLIKALSGQVPISISQVFTDKIPLHSHSQLDNHLSGSS